MMEDPLEVFQLDRTSQVYMSLFFNSNFEKYKFPEVGETKNLVLPGEARILPSSKTQ